MGESIMNKSADKNSTYEGKVVVKLGILPLIYLFVVTQPDASHIPTQEPTPSTIPKQPIQDTKEPRRSSTSERDVNIEVKEINPEEQKPLGEEEKKNGLKDVVKEHTTREGVKRSKAVTALFDTGALLLNLLGS
jgi:hypothetical protein